MGIGKTIWLILFCFVLLLGAGLKGYGQDSLSIDCIKKDYSFSDNYYELRRNVLRCQSPLCLLLIKSNNLNYNLSPGFNCNPPNTSPLSICNFEEKLRRISLYDNFLILYKAEEQKNLYQLREISENCYFQEFIWIFVENIYEFTNSQECFFYVIKKGNRFLIVEPIIVLKEKKHCEQDVIESLKEKQQFDYQRLGLIKKKIIVHLPVSFDAEYCTSLFIESQQYSTVKYKTNKIKKINYEY